MLQTELPFRKPGFAFALAGPGLSTRRRYNSGGEFNMQVRDATGPFTSRAIMASAGSGAAALQKVTFLFSNQRFLEGPTHD
jgi:hypothetical protein